MLLYDCPEVYDLFFNDNFKEGTQSFFKKVFRDKGIKQILDCSVKTGQYLIPLQEMGYTVCGTDKNPKMIRRARKNFAAKDIIADLKVANPLNLRRELNKQFDCVMISGNNLANFEKEQIPAVLKEIYALVKKGGYVYIDSRNWDLILKRRQRFYLYNPVIRDKGRVNLLEVWDYQKNNKKMLSNYLVSEEIDNKIVSKRQFFSIFYPFSFSFLNESLRNAGFSNANYFKLGDPQLKDLSNVNWYSVIAQKREVVGVEKKSKGFLNMFK